MSAYIPHFVLTTAKFIFIAHMGYKGSDLTITELLSALHEKAIGLSVRKGESRSQQYVHGPTVETIPFHSECGQYFYADLYPNLNST